ncbi:MAG: hypothetical protein HY300_02380 [Verrucomicrobia bacterium]|nr:hypothetical protein [Verrucomicrobiota bacterium]
MVYYTIYLKNLRNDTGYVDIALESDQLYRDYLQHLEVGVVPCKPYAVTDPANPGAQPGQFVVNLSEIAAITIRRA